MVKTLVLQENMILNVSASNDRASKYMKQNLIDIKERMSKFIIIVKNVKTALLVINRTVNKISEYIEVIEPNDAINQQELTGIYRKFSQHSRIHIFSPKCTLNIY